MTVAQDEELAAEVVALELVPPTLALLAGDLGVATQVHRDLGLEFRTVLVYCF